LAGAIPWKKEKSPRAIQAAPEKISIFEEIAWEKIS
jgi:hypothetical protein